VASFRKINSKSIQLEVDGKHLSQPNDVADEFSKHFQSVYNNPCPVVFPTLLSSSEFLTSASVSDLDVIKAINPLRTAGWEKILQPGRQGFLNARRVTKQAVLLEKLVQQGHKLKM
jgi:hypothetical protein